ncbi:MAG: GNAT family N-acetyltransferase [Bacteroidia bacterium]
MIQIDTFHPSQLPDPAQGAAIAAFLHTALEQYGDPLEQIEACLAYALSDAPGRGGAVFTAKNEHGAIIGAVVVNHTNMQGYIPEHILVYIAVSSEARGQGIGKKLMQAAIDFLPGGIALHVEPDNPAYHLYKALGFTNKYLEMRLAR